MNNTDKYNMVGKIISFLYSENYESTIQNMARDCSVPLAYMRKTIISLLKDPALHNCILPKDPDSYDIQTIRSQESGMHSNEIDFLVNNYLNTPEDCYDQISVGDYDCIEWEAHFDTLSAYTEEILALSMQEYSAIKALGENVLSISRDSVYEKKTTYVSISEVVRNNLETINDAIENKKELLFTYKNKKGKKTPHAILPIDIIRNITDNWIYVQASDNQLYCLGRFTQPCIAIPASRPFPEVSDDPNRKYIWGASIYKKNQHPIHVKLRICPNTSNIVDKIKRDTCLRSATCKWSKDDHFYYYEDDIIGADEFRRWVRSYGASVVVLEPQVMRDKIVSTAREVLENYKNAEEWGKL